MRRLLPLLLLLTLLSACAGVPDQPGGTPQPGATASVGQGDATVDPAATPAAEDGTPSSDDRIRDDAAINPRASATSAAQSAHALACASTRADSSGDNSPSSQA